MSLVNDRDSGRLDPTSEVVETAPVKALEPPHRSLITPRSLKPLQHQEQQDD